uniref:Uncharacterized protein n=1 Tax=Heterorhabditis bacteriophora TaxID=37862 RepID=A0A1I7WSL1_HETBA
MDALLFERFTQGTPAFFNSKFRWRKCYGLRRVQCYGTSRLGVCLDEDEQRVSFTFQEVNATIHIWLEDNYEATMD